MERTESQGLSAPNLELNITANHVDSVDSRRDKLQLFRRNLAQLYRFQGET